MSLPFRRRHHDNETVHDRARAILAMSFLEPSEPADAEWYEAHLASCAECRREHEAYLADRELLRSLRDRQPEPPRDLWARTAAAIEGEARRGRGAARPFPAPLRRVPGPVPLGILSGALVILVLVATSLLGPGGGAPAPSTFNSQVARASTPSLPEATRLAVVTTPVGLIRQGANGSYELVFADVDSVCPNQRTTGCAPLADRSTAPIALNDPPRAVTLSPSAEELVVATGGGSNGGGDVLVVPVAKASGSPATLTPSSLAPPSASASAASSLRPSPTSSPSLRTASPSIAPTASSSGGPSGSPTASTASSAAPTPSGARAIATGVTVVGQPRYSEDGRWVAFSAKPLDGSTGPDLYLWRVGDASSAERVTNDHGTYFAGWEQGHVLASRVSIEATGPADSPAPSGTSGSSLSASPSAASPGSPRPSSSPALSAGPSPSSIAATASAPPSDQHPVEGHPVSLLIDPGTHVETPLPWTDMWQPVVDPHDASVVFWSGTLVRGSDGEWSLGTGQVVLDSWARVPPEAIVEPEASTDASAATPTSRPLASAASSPRAASSATPRPAATTIAPRPSTSNPTSTSAAPGASDSASPSASVQPAVPTTLAGGPVTAFHARFDPTGTRLALWSTTAPHPTSDTVGDLRLVVVDPTTSGVVPNLDPLPTVPALAGFSIDAGRLAWVTPPGQDGDGSLVRVLAWAGDAFGQVQTYPAQRLLVVP